MSLFDDFIATALIASLLVGLIGSYLGLFVVLRRVIFVGAALAQLASAGVAVALLAEWPLAVGAGLLTFLGASFFSVEPPGQRLPRDSWVAAAYAGSGAAAVLLLASAPHGEGHMQEILFGNILGVDLAEISWMAAVFASVGILHMLASKEFRLTTFDPIMARTLGYRVPLWNFGFFLTLGATIAVATHAAGVLLVFSFLVFPPLTGLILSRRWWGAAAVSAASSVVASGAGVWASVRWDLPTGASIVAVSFGIFCAAVALGKLTRRV
ncbi:MAG: metal ABC transporter permease [Armatimonadetes bacterium]|nr:metal ABC transporter permease [Armatimonadota bacterium]